MTIRNTYNPDNKIIDKTPDMIEKTPRKQADIGKYHPTS